MKTSKISIKDVIKNYESILFDSYGVLFDGLKPIDGSIELINHLNKINYNYFILTNDASITDEERSKIFINQGLNISREKIISAGSLICNLIKKENFLEKKCFVYGTKSIKNDLRNKGIKLLRNSEIEKAEIIIFSDVEKWPTIENLNKLLNLFYKKYSEKKFIKIILPNPDIIYPIGNEHFNFGAAAFIDMLEQAIFRIFGKNIQYKVIRLGKPYEMIFEIAKSRCKSNKIIMIGDQLETDILGANNVKIDSALVTTGINTTKKKINIDKIEKNLLPKFILDSIRL